MSVYFWYRACRCNIFHRSDVGSVCSFSPNRFAPPPAQQLLVALAARTLCRQGHTNSHSPTRTAGRHRLGSGTDETPNPAVQRKARKGPQSLGVPHSLHTFPGFAGHRRIRIWRDPVLRRESVKFRGAMPRRARAAEAPPQAPPALSEPLAALLAYVLRWLVDSRRAVL